MTDWDRLLSGCGASNSTQGSNPCLPACSGCWIPDGGWVAGIKHPVSNLALVAQWIERLVADQKAAGSNPAEGTEHIVSAALPHE